MDAHRNVEDELKVTIFGRSLRLLNACSTEALVAALEGSSALNLQQQQQKQSTAAVLMMCGQNTKGVNCALPSKKDMVPICCPSTITSTAHTMGEEKPSSTLEEEVTTRTGAVVVPTTNTDNTGSGAITACASRVHVSSEQNMMNVAVQEPSHHGDEDLRRRNLLGEKENPIELSDMEKENRAESISLFTTTAAAVDVRNVAPDAGSYTCSAEPCMPHDTEEKVKDTNETELQQPTTTTIFASPLKEEEEKVGHEKKDEDQNGILKERQAAAAGAEKTEKSLSCEVDPTPKLTSNMSTEELVLQQTREDIPGSETAILVEGFLTPVPTLSLGPSPNLPLSSLPPKPTTSLATTKMDEGTGTESTQLSSTAVHLTPSLQSVMKAPPPPQPQRSKAELIESAATRIREAVDRSYGYALELLPVDDLRFLSVLLGITQPTSAPKLSKSKLMSMLWAYHFEHYKMPERRKTTVPAAELCPPPASAVRSTSKRTRTTTATGAGAGSSCTSATGVGLGSNATLKQPGERTNGSGRSRRVQQGSTLPAQQTPTTTVLRQRRRVEAVGAMGRPLQQQQQQQQQQRGGGVRREDQKQKTNSAKTERGTTTTGIKKEKTAVTVQLGGGGGNHPSFHRGEEEEGESDEDVEEEQLHVTGDNRLFKRTSDPAVPPQQRATSSFFDEEYYDDSQSCSTGTFLLSKTALRQKIVSIVTSVMVVSAQTLYQKLTQLQEFSSASKEDVNEIVQELQNEGLIMSEHQVLYLVG